MSMCDVTHCVKGKERVGAPKNGSGDPKKKFQVLGLNCLKQ